MWLYIIGAVWLVCGVITYGMALAYLQRGFPTLAYQDRRLDTCTALFFGSMGIVGLAVVFPMTDCAHHGLQWIPMTKRYYEALKTYEALGR